MKASHFTALALLFALGMRISRANLGDTEAQCVAKYGSESDVQDGLGYHAVGDRTATFHVKTASGSLNMRVVFLQGRVAHEEISSLDPSSPLSVGQMKAILDSESADSKWQKGNSVFRSEYAGSTYGSQNWERGDGAIATFWLTGKAKSQEASGQMELSTKRYADAKAFFEKEDGGN